MIRQAIVNAVLKIYHRVHSRYVEAYPRKKSDIPGADILGDKKLVKIGERVSFGGNVSIMANAPVEIGSDSLIASGVKILTSTHDSTQNPMWKARIDRPVHIGSSVWIGTNAIIMPGIRIGNNSIIGAGSIVNKHVPEGVIVAGNPARFIRKREAGDYDSTAIYPGEIITGTFLPDTQTIRITESQSDVFQRKNS